MTRTSQLETVIDAVFGAVRKRLGADSDPHLMQLVVREVVAAMSQSDGDAGDITAARPDMGQPGRKQRSRAIITASGRNCKGQVAEVASAIAESGGDIMDMSQTIVSDFFTMIMVVDISALDVPFGHFKSNLDKAAQKLSIQITAIHEDVLRALQRV